MFPVGGDSPPICIYVWPPTVIYSHVADPMQWCWGTVHLSLEASAFVSSPFINIYLKLHAQLKWNENLNSPDPNLLLLNEWALMFTPLLSSFSIYCYTSLSVHTIQFIVFFSPSAFPINPSYKFLLPWVLTSFSPLLPSSSPFLAIMSKGREWGYCSSCPNEPDHATVEHQRRNCLFCSALLSLYSHHPFNSPLFLLVPISYI